MSDDLKQSAAPVKVGLACRTDPRDPSAFSGVLSGLVSGLETLGYQAEAAVASLPPPTDFVLRAFIGTAKVPMAWVGSWSRPRRSGPTAGLLRESAWRLIASPTLAVLRSWMVQRDLRRAGALVGCIQFGSAEFWLPRRLPYPYVTYDDQTVIQAKESYEYEWITNLRPREFNRLVKWQRAAYASASACCAENEWAASSIVQDYGIPADRVHVVGAGIGQVLAPAERNWEQPRFLFVGKDWERKNGAKVVAAFGRVRERFESATLDVVGDHPPLDLPGVVGHGLIPPCPPDGFSKLSDLYQRATCLVVPSKHEPAAIAYLEAAAAGVGSIATRVGGSSTFVGDAGILVDPERDEELLAAMMAFADPAVAEDFGRRAQARARLFTWPLVAGRLVRAMTGSSDGPDFL